MPYSICGSARVYAGSSLYAYEMRLNLLSI